jgi:hypothetical protein
LRTAAAHNPIPTLTLPFEVEVERGMGTNEQKAAVLKSNMTRRIKP